MTVFSRVALAGWIVAAAACQASGDAGSSDSGGSNAGGTGSGGSDSGTGTSVSGTSTGATSSDTATVGASGTSSGSPTATSTGVSSTSSGPTCDAGATCDTGNPCDVGQITCNANTPTCTKSGNVADGTTCAMGSTCLSGICKQGGAVIATGTCTYTQGYRILSCPEGMACECYDTPSQIFKNSASVLDLWQSDTTLEVTGGMVPTNQAMPTVMPASITLTSIATPPQTGNQYPYVATVNGDAIQVTVYVTEGYIPENFVKYSDADCGYSGNTLSCSFQSP